MARDAELTKQKLLDAATAEFAAFGIAGARIDRIASAAGVNKQLIYAYFGNKDDLFDAAFSAYVTRSLEDVQFDASNLPAYAGRLFDRFEKKPEELRLSTWYRLERPEGTSLEAVIAINKSRIQRLRDAQRSGQLASHFDPVQLLTLIQAVATSWATTNPEFAASRPTSRASRRRTVVEAVRRLIESDDAGGT